MPTFLPVYNMYLCRSVWDTADLFPMSIAVLQLSSQVLTLLSSIGVSLMHGFRKEYRINPSYPGTILSKVLVVLAVLSLQCTVCHGQDCLTKHKADSFFGQPWDFPLSVALVTWIAHPFSLRGESYLMFRETQTSSLYGPACTLVTAV